MNKQNRIKKYIEAIKGAQFLAGFVIGLCVMFLGGKSFLSWSTAAPPLAFQELEYVSLQGDTLALGEDASGYRLLYFWASWHKRCAKDLPRLAAACEALKAKGCTCIAISDENPKVIQTFSSGLHENIHFFHYPGAFFEIGLKGLPSYYLLNEKEEILFSKTGVGHWENPKTLQKLTSYLP